MTALLLFGAGASYGSGACWPGVPPLGNGQGGLFQMLQRHGACARRISAGHADLFIHNFEAGLVLLRDNNSVELGNLMRQMASYFAPFTPQTGNLYTFLPSIVRSCKRRITIATTNYDLLIERALQQGGQAFTYGQSEDARKLSLLKIHGSCNWLPKQNVSFRNVQVKLSSGPWFEGEHDATFDTNEIVEFCDGSDSRFPCMALYAPGKEVLCGAAQVKLQLKYWNEAVENAQRVVVVGLRVHTDDDHIWGVLSRSAAQVCYVGMEPAEFDAWNSQRQFRDRGGVLGRSFGDCLESIAEQLDS